MIRYITILTILGMSARGDAYKYNNLSRDDIAQFPSNQLFTGSYSFEMPPSLNIRLIDSSRTQYTFWRQIQDPIWYSESGDTIVFAWRGFEVDQPYYIACAVSTDEGNTWYVERRLNEQTGVLDGGGIYVSATRQANRPVISYIEWLTPLDLGRAANISGNFEGNSSDWFGNRSEDLDAFHNIPIPMPNSSVVLNLLDTFDGLKAITYNAATGEMGGPYTVDPDFYMVGADRLGDTVMAFGFSNLDGSLLYYSLDASSGQWSGPFEFRAPDVDTLPNGEILSNLNWADGIILNDGTPLMVVDLGDETEIDTVMASRSVWVIKPDTAIRLWIAPTTHPVFHAAYSQLSIDRSSGIVYAFWMQLDNWRGDTTGYGSWDIWYAYSTDHGYTWSDPINLTNTPGLDEAMFQVAKRVVNGRTWVGFLRPTGGRIEDLYYHVVADGEVFFSNVFLGYVEGLGVEEMDHEVIPNRTVIQNNALLFFSATTGVVNIEIFDITGRTMHSWNHPVVRGKNLIRIPVDQITSGLYFVRISVGQGKSSVLKFIRIK